VSREGRLNAWRLLGASALVLLAAWVCREAWLEITRMAWVDEEYSHILLLPLVIAFLVWVRRLRLRHFAVTGTWLGPVILVAGLTCYTFGLEHNRQFLFHSGAVISVLGVIVSVLGKNAVFKFMPAVVVLAFIVPVPYQIRLAISETLQVATAHVSQFVFRLVSIETVVGGNTLFINGQPIAIAEACNGMRLVFPLFLIAFAFAFGLPLRGSVRTLLILASPVVALIANVVRTIPTIYLYSVDRWWGDQFHNWAGWAMLPVAFVVLLGLIRLMRWAQLPIQRYTFVGQ
jgi:exosortase